MSAEPAAPDAALVTRLVQANRILYKRGIVDGFGHVSTRHDKSPGHYLLSRSKAPALVAPDDILVHDLDGHVVGTPDSALYLERFIHGEIYRARPDVAGIVHCHSQGSVLFGVTGQRLRPVCHMSGFLGAGSRHFEIADEGGDSNLLITSPALGRSLATQLADASCVLMRGHGMTVAGRTLEDAVYRAIYAEANAHLQIAATAMGQVRYLSEGEAAMTADTIFKGMDRTWKLWCAEVDV